MKQKGYELEVILIWLTVVIVGGIGWVKNIIEIVHSDFAHITGMLVVRLIGVFIVPLGAILGYF